MDMDSREYYRYSIFARASILVKNEIDSVAIKTEVSNIAETGLGAYSAEPIGLGSEVSINIEFLSTEGEMKNDAIEGKVVWLSMEGDIYYAGIFFDEELNPDKQPNLYWHFHRIIKDD
jgi:c-di-GMP-binding flagellar brake protein YcgR